MKILFSMRHSGALRNYSSTIGELARRGHHVHLVFMMTDKLGDGRLLWEVTNDHANVTFSEIGKKTPWRFWLGLARGVRSATDYVRYGTPEFKDAHALRERAAERVPSIFSGFLKLPAVRSSAGVALVSRLLNLIERAIPADQSIADLIAEQSPDAVLVTPLVDIGSDQVEYIKACQTLGIRSALCVHSWDNLTNKGLMHARLDRVVVWNEAQRSEAVDLQGAAPDSIVVTGAWPYEHWHGWRPSGSRAEFFGRLGLPAERAMILYVCSSRFIAEHERPVVARWVRALRSAADERVATANIVVRPHPLNGDEWGAGSLADLPGVAVFPPGGAEPVDDASRTDYFDSISHADAVVGVNTSALIESAIIDRPALALPDFRSSQEELPHFRLLVGELGMLAVSASLGEHVAQLSVALADPERGAAARRRFVESFIRPAAGAPSPAERVVELVDELLDSPPVTGPAGAHPRARMHA